MYDVYTVLYSSHFTCHRHEFNCIFCSTVSTQSVRVESTPQPSCLNEPIVFVCLPDFNAATIQWVHTAFGTLGFTTLGSSVGNTTSTSDGQFVANLTMKDANGALLASTLTINLPLNTSLNNTMITCNGGSTATISGFATIVLEG